MTNEEHAKKLGEILIGPHHAFANETKIEIASHAQFPSEYFISFTDMYEAPPITAAMLDELAKYFGTMKIDVDHNIAELGCETCDYGSAYGHTIIIKEATI